MFGYVMANPQELRPEQRERYLGCYCGICRAFGAQLRHGLPGPPAVVSL